MDDNIFNIGQHVIPKRYPNLGCGSPCSVIGIYTNERGPLYDVEFLDSQMNVQSKYFKPSELVAGS